MPSPPPEISVVVPMFQEEDSVATVVPRMLESLGAQRRSFELIAVNDGSRDRTGERLDGLAAREPRLRVVHFARNYGQTAALMAGFWAARAPVIVPLDGDGQNEPDDIGMLVDKLEEGYDVVSGWRKDRKDSWLRTRVSRVANWLIGRLTGVRLHDYGCTLKAYRASMIRDSRLYGEMHRFIPVFTSMHGAKIAELVVRHHPRQAGTSKYGYDRIFKVLFDLVLVRMLQRYRTKPMHFFGKITKWSWFATAACLLFAIGSAVYTATYHPETGWWSAFWGKAPLVGVMFFLLGGFSVMLGLVAELAMRAAYEFNAGRYWDEARRVNFGPGPPPGAAMTRPGAVPVPPVGDVLHH
ncbi:MAG: glycosyltransferase family 2 protein [Planctomycetes bacterium]|nr:glycosyltransferase family 2 protein [Planctomycetota bacterium]